MNVSHVEKYLSGKCNIRGEILNIAVKICGTITIRTRKVQKMAFICMYHAYKKLGLITTPRHVAKIVNLPFKEIVGSSTLFSKNTTYEIIYIDVTPKDLIFFFWRGGPGLQLGLRSYHNVKIKNILRYNKTVMHYLKQKKSQYLQRKPSIIAASILYSYFTKCKNDEHEYEKYFYDIFLVDYKSVKLFVKYILQLCKKYEIEN